MSLPNAKLLDILEEAYRPCAEFEHRCTSMRWAPEEGHVPRGFIGATGHLSEVELVLVVAEPGDPQSEESYDLNQSPRELLESACRFVHRSLAEGRDLFHRNVRSILDQCFPEATLDEQLRRTWITESVLCSAKEETEDVPAPVCRACGSRYLQAQIELLSDPLVGALGYKARDRLRKYVPGVTQKDFVGGYHASPPGCYHDGAEESWQNIARQVRGSAK